MVDKNPKSGYCRRVMKVKEDTLDLFYGTEFQHVAPFKTQLLKWIGNKQRFAHKIASFFPTDIRTYREPFLGSGAVLAALQPPGAVGSDICGPLMEIWQCLHDSPDQLVNWYEARYSEFKRRGRPEGYEHIKARYNSDPNGADLLFICRSCYGGLCGSEKVMGTSRRLAVFMTPLPPGRLLSEWRYGGGERLERISDRWILKKPCPWRKRRTLFTAIRPMSAAKRFSTGDRTSHSKGCCVPLRTARNVVCGLL